MCTCAGRFADIDVMCACAGRFADIDVMCTCAGRFAKTVTVDLILFKYEQSCVF